MSGTQWPIQHVSPRKTNRPRHPDRVKIEKEKLTEKNHYGDGILIVNKLQAVYKLDTTVGVVQESVTNNGS